MPAEAAVIVSRSSAQRSAFARSVAVHASSVSAMARTIRLLRNDCTDLQRSTVGQGQVLPTKKRCWPVVALWRPVLSQGTIVRWWTSVARPWSGMLGPVSLVGSCDNVLALEEAALLFLFLPLVRPRIRLTYRFALLRTQG